METWDLDSIDHIEELKLLLLNRSNKVLGISSLSKGGRAGTFVNVKLLLHYTIKVNSNAIILCNNHPNGNLQPSEADNAINGKIEEAAQLMDIQLLDHLILIPEGRYYSYGDEGLI